MRHRTLRRPFALTVLVAAALAGTIASASAAGHAGTLRNPRIFAEPPAPPPIMPVPMPTGINTCCHNEAGVPDTSTPGIIGTGAAPSGLPGDSPTAPGFPAIIGH